MQQGPVGCYVFLCLVMTSNSEVPEHLTEKEHNITSMVYLGVIPLKFSGSCDDAICCLVTLGKSLTFDFPGKSWYLLILPLRVGSGGAFKNG